MLRPGIQRFVVSPNEQATETPYSHPQHRHHTTALISPLVRTRNFSGDADTHARWHSTGRRHTHDVRLWDPPSRCSRRRPNTGAAPRITTFVSVSTTIRYVIDGDSAGDALARELNARASRSRTSITSTSRLRTVTALTLGPVNEVTQEGLPILFVKHSAASTVPASVDIKEPSIYFGEVTQHYVLVNTNAKEFHHSKAEGRRTSNGLQRADGVRISGLARRLPSASVSVAPDAVQQRHHRR